MKGQLDVGVGGTMANDDLELWQRSLKIGDKVWVIEENASTKTVKVVEAVVEGVEDSEKVDPCPHCTRSGPVVWDRDGFTNLNVPSWNFSRNFQAKNVFETKEVVLRALIERYKRGLKGIERERAAAVRAEKARIQHENEITERIADFQKQLDGDTT